MANPEHLAILQQGVDVWNQWRKENPDVQPNLYMARLRGAKLRETNFGETNFVNADLNGADLGEANLSRAYLYRADLADADLRKANLSEAHLFRADLIWANLANADLRGADLSWADLRGAKLIRANLRGADLRETELHGADLAEADLSEVRLGYATLADIDLSQARGLDRVIHEGPSSIGIDTIYKSLGNIPDEFLRGCGVPDQFIGYAHSIVGEPIGYYSCFISYAQTDRDFATRLYSDLQTVGVSCWLDVKELRVGADLRKQISESIKAQDRILLVLSQASAQSSWVNREVKNALQLEQDRGKTVLFPIRIDDAIFSVSDSPEIGRLRERYIGDFRGWQDQGLYKQAFSRLVRDLAISASVESGRSQ